MGTAAHIKAVMARMCQARPLRLASVSWGISRKMAAGPHRGGQSMNDHQQCEDGHGSSLASCSHDGCIPAVLDLGLNREGLELYRCS